MGCHEQLGGSRSVDRSTAHLGVSSRETRRQGFAESLGTECKDKFGHHVGLGPDALEPLAVLVLPLEGEKLTATRFAEAQAEQAVDGLEDRLLALLAAEQNREAVKGIGQRLLPATVRRTDDPDEFGAVS
jgi:hypothetical protein